MGDPLSMHDPRSAIFRLKSMLDVPVEKRDMVWAHDLCTCSRFVHVNVWRFCPEPRVVEREIIPLLKQSQKELSALRARRDLREGEKKKISEYGANARLRLRNIEQNYVRGKRSAFLPTDKLWKKEPPAE